MRRTVKVWIRDAVYRYNFARFFGFPMRTAIKAMIMGKARCENER